MVMAGGCASARSASGPRKGGLDMASHKALRSGYRRRNRAKIPALWRTFAPRGPSDTTSPPADSFRRKLAMVAMVFAVLVLVGGGFLVVILGHALAQGARWSVTWVGPP